MCRSNGNSGTKDCLVDLDNIVCGLVDLAAPLKDGAHTLPVCHQIPSEPAVCGRRSQVVPAQCSIPKLLNTLCMCLTAIKERNAKIVHGSAISAHSWNVWSG